jgi:hypothetical protein
MIVISHRGNIDGPNPKTENKPHQIEKVISMDVQVEIDVRFVENSWYLGHDDNQNRIDLSFLQENKEMLWCHAKNIFALERMLEAGLHCFWHQEDYYTLTSKGIIWAYPNHYTGAGILVMPSKELIDKYRQSIYGICVDDIREFI